MYIFCSAILGPFICFSLQLVTACNDGARQMDRTEQLHEIHKKLDFEKLRPFPIVWHSGPTASGAEATGKE